MLRGSRRGCRTQLVGWTPNLREVATLSDGTGSEVGGRLQGVAKRTAALVSYHGC